MGSNPIGPTGPHVTEDEEAGQSVAAASVGAAQPQQEKIGPSGPHSAPAKPNKTAQDIGPSGPHTP
jgi:hypothetical protein